MILKTLKEIARLLAKGNIPYMIIGGQAVAQYGIPRFTQDIDITVGLTPEDIDHVLKAVKQMFRVLPRNVKGFVQKTWVLPIEHIETEIRVDLIFSITPFEQNAIKKAKEIVIEDVGLRYILPEDLVVQKVIAERPRDLEDAKGILEVQGENIDITQIEKTIKKLAKESGEKAWFTGWQKLKQEITK